MYLFLIIGHTGQGKTQWLKNFIGEKNQYIFDLNNEYNLPPDTNGNLYPRMRHTDLDIDKFVNTVGRLKNTNIVFEDATGFLRGRQGAPLMRRIVAKRHSGNNFFIFFHSINRVPPELMEMSNYIVLFKTIDNIDSMRKFNNDNLTRAFLELQKEEKYSFKILQLIWKNLNQNHGRKYCRKPV